MFAVRPETPSDYAAVADVIRAAFAEEGGGEEEVALVERLRTAGQAIVSLVASAPDDAGKIAGHILFIPLRIETPKGVFMGAALAPMAVAPESQRQGIGSALVQAGLDRCRQQFLSAVIVLGHPEYYPRFGFSAELARNLTSPYSGLGDAWMALELAPSVLSGVAGTVRYPEAFAC